MSLRNESINSKVGDGELRPIKPKGWGKRHMQVLLGFLICAISFLMNVKMSIAIVAMTDYNQNNTAQVYDWDKKVQSIVLSSYFWGKILAQIPAGLIIHKFGGKLPTVISLAVLTTFSMMFPLLTKWGGAYAACFCRAIQGLSQGVVFPALHSTLGQWAPLSERATMTTYSHIGSQVGKIGTMAVSGMLASTSVGWPLIFYVAGMVSFTVTALVIWLGSSSPLEHSTISEKELKYILDARGSTRPKRPKTTPWREILTCVPVWAAIASNIGNSWAAVVLMIEMPTYLGRVMGLNIKTNGLLSSVPYVAMFLFSVFLAHCFDYFLKRGTLSITTTRKISNTIGLWLSGAALIGFAFVPSNEIILAMCLLIITLGLNAGITMGFMVTFIDMSPNFTNITTAMGCFAGYSASALSPMLVGYIVTDQDNQTQWRYVFCIAAVVMFVGNAIFLIFGTSETQSWNNPNSTEIQDSTDSELKELNNEKNDAK